MKLIMENSKIDWSKLQRRSRIDVFWHFGKAKILQCAEEKVNSLLYICYSIKKCPKSSGKGRPVNSNRNETDFFFIDNAYKCILFAE